MRRSICRQQYSYQTQQLESRSYDDEEQQRAALCCSYCVLVIIVSPGLRLRHAHFINAYVFL
jgi:hypothetical protein